MAQGMQESCITDPSLFLDQLILHDGDVSAGTAEADPPQLPPEKERFREGRPLRRSESPIAPHSRSPGQAAENISAKKL